MKNSTIKRCRPRRVQTSIKEVGGDDLFPVALEVLCPDLVENQPVSKVVIFSLSGRMSTHARADAPDAQACPQIARARFNYQG
jgi:hypothetical protein